MRHWLLAIALVSCESGSKPSERLVDHLVHVASGSVVAKLTAPSFVPLVVVVQPDGSLMAGQSPDTFGELPAMSIARTTLFPVALDRLAAEIPYAKSGPLAPRVWDDLHRRTASPPEPPEPDEPVDTTRYEPEEGLMGKPDSSRTLGQYQMKKTSELPTKIAEPIWLAPDPAAPARALIDAIAATGGGVLVEYGGKPVPLAIAFDKTGFDIEVTATSTADALVARYRAGSGTPRLVAVGAVTAQQLVDAIAAIGNAGAAKIALATR